MIAVVWEVVVYAVGVVLILFGIGTVSVLAWFAAVELVIRSRRRP